VPPQAVAAPSALTPANRGQALPSWYTPENAPRTSAAPSDNGWDKYDPAPAANKAEVGAADPSSWDRFDVAPEQVTVTGYRGQPESVDHPAADFVANTATGIARVPGAILGTPDTLLHFADWIGAKAINGMSHLPFVPTQHLTGADLDKSYVNPIGLLKRVMPSPEQVDNHVVFPAASAVSRAFGGSDVKPYEPTTPLGRIYQAGVTGLAGGFVDPLAIAGAAKNGVGVGRALLDAAPNAAKLGAASAAAQGTQEGLPNTPGIAAITALLAHGGLTTAGNVSGRGAGAIADATRQLVSPSAQGEREAARVLGQANAQGPALVQPSPADIATAMGNVRSATDTLSPGLEPWQAGQRLRDLLQERNNSLVAERMEVTEPLRQARDTSPNFINTEPVLSLIDRKLDVAAGAQQQALQGARADMFLADGAERADAEQLAATRTALNERISTAKRGGDNATAVHLLDVRNALDEQVAKYVPEATQYSRTYAEASKPLDPLQYGPVGKVLERDPFNSRYTFAEERIPDLFLRSPATRTDLDQLVRAFGGDRSAALGALEQHLTGVTQGAIAADGTLDTAAFDRAMKPYTKAMNGNVEYWFPALAKKFADAKAAQSTLDTLTTQRGLVDAIGAGALRDGSGVVTGDTFGRWLSGNRDALEKTQSPSAIMRLQSIANALKGSRPGELADVLKSELAPTALGTLLGGLEGGVLSTLLHKTTQSTFGGLDARRQAAFSFAIERATLDPAYASRIVAAYGRARQGGSPVRALVRAIAATPISLNALHQSDLYQ
jgi:hypothetical protein